ncbi:MAG: hypothetical protein ABIK07_14245 [Planctomycetota bacterium]
MANSIKKHIAALANKRDAAAIRPLFTGLNTSETATVALANELRTDHATFKTAVDQTETLIEELHDDHATFKTAVDQTETLIEELHDDHATFKTAVDDLKTLVNNLRTAMLYSALGNPAFVIDTNFDVKNGSAISYTNGGTLATFNANTSFDTGTAQVITADKWSAALLSVSSGGAATVTWSSTLNADSEALAIAALPALPSNHTPLGYVTVLTGSGVTWTAGTDALQGGTGGTPSADTNYYNAINPAVATIITAAVSSSAPATLTAPKPASGPATLTAPKPASGPATISAAALVAQLEA